MGLSARRRCPVKQVEYCPMKLIIPMAGRGTRVRPHSHVTPKPLLNVRGKSMVERIVDTFNAVLPRPLDTGVFVLAPDFGEEIQGQLSDICDRHGMEAVFAVQDSPKGTAHAVAAAGEELVGEGIVVFADTLFYMEPGVDLSDADVVAWVKHVEDPSRFGVAVREGGRIVELVEKPQTLISHEALIGIYYVRDLAVMARAVQDLFDQDRSGPGGEYFLTDAFDIMLKGGDVFRTATVTDWLDCGTIPALMDTTRVVLDREDSESGGGKATDSVIHPPVYLGPGVEVTNSVVGPYVSLEAGARVTDSVVRDAIVFADATIRSSSLSDSLVGQKAVVNNFSGKANIGDHSTIG
jgi:glucose-1-phosphate thymidylyltransferase